MRVAVDARMAAHSGIGRHLRGLAGALAAPGVLGAGEEVILLLNPGQDASWVPSAPGLRAAVLPRVVPVYSPKESLFLPAAVRALGPDLLHVPHFNVPWDPGLPFTATLHDLVYWRFPRSTGSVWGGLYARTLLRRCVARARRLLTVSQATATDLRDLLGADPGRVDIVPNGMPGAPSVPDTRSEALQEAWGGGKGYVLYVGNFLPHKRLDVLLRAFGVLAAQGRRIPLVLVGKEDARSEALRRSAEARALGNGLVFAAYLEDEALDAAYAGARLAVSPSPWEGFGFPALEALARGVPVVGIRSGATPEVLGDAGLLVPPEDPLALAGAILSLWSDPALRTRLLSKAPARLAAYPWRAAAEGTLASWRLAVAD